MKSPLLFLILICWIGSYAESQYSLENVYTVEDGMGMSETQSCEFDDIGHLWTISTNGLVSRFDGQHFYTLSPNLRGGIFIKLNQGALLLKVGNRNYPVGEYYIHLRGSDTTHLPIRNCAFIDNFASDQLTLATNDSLYFFDYSDHFQHSHTVDISGLSIDVNKAWPQIKIAPSGEIIKYTKSSERFSASLAFDSTTYVSPNEFRYGHMYWPNRSRVVYENGKYYFFDSNGEVLPPTRIGLPDENPEKYLRYHHNSRILQIEETILPTNKTIKSIYISDVEKPYFSLLGRFGAQRGYTPHPTRDQAGNIYYGDHSGIRVIHPGIRTFISGQENMLSALHSLAELSNGHIVFGGYGTGIAVWDGNTLSRINSTILPATTKIMPGAFNDTKYGYTYMLLERSLDFPEALIRFDHNGNASRHIIAGQGNRAATGFQMAPVKLQRSFWSPTLDRDDNRLDAEAISIGLVGVKDSDNSPFYGQIAFVSLSDQPSLEMRVIGHQKGIDIGNVLTTCQDLNGRIWFANPRDGMGFYDPVRDTAFTYLAEPETPFGAISSVLDSTGSLWLGTARGLAYLPNPHLIDET
ncbi:MAG: hypothetical protein AAFY91_08865, partial [Bacteroidota bacterium]